MISNRSEMGAAAILALAVCVASCGSEGDNSGEGTANAGGSGGINGAGGNAFTATGGSAGAGPQSGGATGSGGQGSGGSAGTGGGQGSGGAAGTAGAAGSGGGAGTAGSAGTGGGGGTAGSAGSGSDGGEPPPPPEETCTPSVSRYDTSNATAVIGTGTAASCTEVALRTAAEQGGVIAFNCGESPVTIDITQTIELPIDRDTIIDGGDRVTLDAGKRTRHFHFEHPDWLNNTAKVVLQGLVLQNGQAPLGQYFPPLANPECAYGYKEGSGGAIYMRNGNLEVIDTEFYDNEAALIGPDVGGGAIYALGSPSVIISGSRFVGNRAANGGAIGMLFANPEIYNSVFENNTAEGVGMNTAGHVGCPDFGHPEQGGAGGLSGAVYFDGLNDAGHIYAICGTVFRNNRSNELGGALFRTPNSGQREMLIDRCVFENNTARMGGVSFIKDNLVVVRDSFFGGNRSGLNVAGEQIGGPLGGLWVNTGTVDIVNSTFHDNQPTGLNVEGSGSTITNATFSSSRLEGTFQVTNSLFVNTSCTTTRAGSDNVQWPQGTACAQGTIFADPGLGAPADNGGPTPTLFPANASAITGVGQDCPLTDQRGEPRDTASCAAGAVEP